MKANETNVCAVCIANGKYPKVTLYWHYKKEDKENNTAAEIWCYCLRCQRGYDIHSYCFESGLDLRELLRKEFDFQEAESNEVQRQNWPDSFKQLSDPLSQPGVKYILERGIKPHRDMAYDTKLKGVVFPYYYDDVFVGSQTRLLTPWVFEEGNECKITTMPGTRLGLLFYRYNGVALPKHVKGVIVTEGALNALAIQEAFDDYYGSEMDHSWRAIACSGSSATPHQVESMAELVEKGYKVILAPDTDAAGVKMMNKFKEGNAFTHLAFTNNSSDWIDMYKANKPGFMKWFLGRIVKNDIS